MLTLPTRARWPKSPLGVEKREGGNKLHVVSFTCKCNGEMKLGHVTIHTNDPAELFACLQVNCSKVAGSGSSVSQGTLLYVFGRVGKVEKRGEWEKVR